MRSLFKNRAAASAAALALGAGVLAAPALGHTIGKPTAVAAAKAAAAKAKRQTHARSSKVLGCHRQTDHQFFCKFELKFKSGASRCTADVTVKYASASSSAVRSRTSNFRCF
jgi:hypothetical protein